MCPNNTIMFVAPALLLALMLQDATTQSLRPPSTAELVASYSRRVDGVVAADREERTSSRRSLDGFQARLVRDLASRRLQRVLHTNRTFGEIQNDKWADCLHAKRSKINELETVYDENGGPCIQKAQSEVMKKKNTVRQIVKETRKWRKGYKYLHRLCKDNNPKDKRGAEACLVDYMQKDNYDNTIARLLEMLQIAQTDFLSQFETSIGSFEECLDGVFSNFIEGVRKVTDSLQKCYKKKISVATAKNEETKCVVTGRSTLKCS